MKNKLMLLPFVLGLQLMLVLVLLGIVGGEGAAILAAPTLNTPDIPSTTWHICPAGPPTCDYATIQEAVDAANSSDSIMVAGGTYSDVHARQGITQVIYVSKTISIEGGYSTADWNDPDPEANPTILDAQGQGRVFYITGTIGVVLDHLQITGGDATGLGGGPWPYDGAGGGIFVVSATVSLDNCRIYGNLASSQGPGGGGGVYLYDSPSVLISNEIYSNTASLSDMSHGEGGGLVISQGDVTLIGNTFKDNVGSGMAGGGLGGGAYVELSDSLFRGNLFMGNIAGKVDWAGGGGIWFSLNDTSLLINNAFVGNYSGPDPTSQGSAVVSEWSYPRLVHTTIHDNRGGNATGVEVFMSSSVIMTNTIIVSQSIGVLAESGSDVTLDGVLWYANGTPTSGTIVVNYPITADPMFASDGYHLRYSSAATDTALDVGEAFDIDRQHRPFGFGPDLGADELVVEIENLNPLTNGALTYVDDQGLTTTIDIPREALSELITLVFIPRPTPLHDLAAGLHSAQHAFDLDVFQTGQPKPGYTFQEPIHVTIYYSDLDIAGIDETTLRLYYWTGSMWKDAVDTCTPPSSYVRDLAQNKLSVPICHLSEWHMGGAPIGGPGFRIYLPLVMRTVP
jgi:hypothetical protein